MPLNGLKLRQLGSKWNGSTVVGSSSRRCTDSNLNGIKRDRWGIECRRCRGVPILILVGAVDEGATEMDVTQSILGQIK